MKVTKVDGIVDQLKASSLSSNSLYSLYDFVENATYGDAVLRSDDIEFLVNKDSTINSKTALQIIKVADECEITEKQSNGYNKPNFVAMPQGIFLDGHMATIKEHLDEYKEFVKTLQEKRVVRIEIEL